MKSLISSILIIFLLANQVVSLGCLNEHGKNVDHFIALRIHGASPRKMMKFDPATKKFKGLSSENEGEQFLKQLFDQVDPKNHKIFAFNDAYPDKNVSLSQSSSGNAHAKGVLVVDKDGKGFFLQHSVPKFPAFDPEHGFNYVTPTSSQFGQNFLCIRITSEKVADQLIENFTYTKVSTYVNTYGKGKPAPKIILKESNYLKIRSFEIFSKMPKDNELLWDDIVAPYYKDDFLTETWGRPYSEDKCEDKNNRISSITNIEIDGVQYKHELDHSKWGITLNKSIWCGGDMNRENTQAARGGSAICIENEDIHSAFKSLIVIDGCGLITQKQLSIIVE